MDESNKKQMDQVEVQNLNVVKNKVKIGFYTSVIFAIVVFIWIYTNPIFKQKTSTQTQAGISINSETLESVDSIGSSFKTMWSDVTIGLSSLKK